METILTLNKVLQHPHFPLFYFFFTNMKYCNHLRDEKNTKQRFAVLFLNHSVFVSMNISMFAKPSMHILSTQSLLLDLKWH